MSTNSALAEMAAFKADLARYREPVDTRPLRDKIAQAMANIEARRELSEPPSPAIRIVPTLPSRKVGFFV